MSNMAEACASSPSASIDDEGPAMDKHGDGIDDVKEVIQGGKQLPPNGLSIIGESTDPKPEVKPIQLSNLPNGCINHNICDDRVVKNDADHDVVQCNINADSVKNVTSDSVTLEEAKSATANHTIESSSSKEMDQDPSSNPKEDIESSVVDCLAKVNLTEEPEDLEGDGVKLDCKNGIEYVVYESELQMTDIMRLITKDLSEPYSIYTYRYFIHNWPKLCFLVSFTLIITLKRVLLVTIMLCLILILIYYAVYLSSG